MALSYNDAIKAYGQISSSKIRELKEMLYKAAIRYAHIRAENFLLEGEELAAADEERTISHNRFIDCCNILSRNQQKEGEDNSWRGILGNDRKVIGDMACYIHLFIGLGER